MGYIKQKGMTAIQEMGLIDRHIEEFGKITRIETAKLCNCDSNHAYYLLRKMMEEGHIRIVGKGRSSYYVRLKNS